MTIYTTGKTAICPVAQLLGSDVDDGRAMQLTDLRVFNRLTGNISHPIPWAARRIVQEPFGVRKLIAALISAQAPDAPSAWLTSLTRQMDGRNAGEVGAALATNAFDATANGVTRIGLQTKDGSLSIKYFDDEIECILAMDGVNRRFAEGTFLIDVQGVTPPDSIKLVLDKMLADGFRIHFFSYALKCTVIMRKGNHARHIHAELSWVLPE